MDIEHDERGHAFLAHLAEGDAALAYDPRPDGSIEVLHTFVPEQARGRGVGEALAGAAFDWARSHRRRVVPSCPFVAQWVRGRPELADLVAR
jgi:predicted GNAT family acetyltransferase